VVITEGAITAKEPPTLIWGEKKKESSASGEDPGSLSA